MTDPAAIDLEIVKNRPAGISDQNAVDKAALIAEVEALRERVTELLQKNGELANWTVDVIDRAEAAGAHATELAAALDAMFKQFEHVAYEGNDLDVLDRARSVLASIPAAALGRGFFQQEPTS